MAGERTPTDELTGMPLLLVPSIEAEYFLAHPTRNSAGRANGGEDDYADWNHVYHPKQDYPSDDVTLQAVRECRAQFVLRTHHSAYHKIYDGPPPPQTREERLRAIVFSLAGLVPRRAIDLSGTSPKITTLNNRQMERLQDPNKKVVQVMRPKSVQEFLLSQVLEPPKLETVPRKLLGAFLDTKVDTLDDRETRMLLTHKILSLAIEPLTEPMHERYRTALAENLWPQSLHSSPRDTVYYHLIGPFEPHGYPRKKAVWRIGALLHERLADNPQLAAAS